jgi:hypothetical protein
MTDLGDLTSFFKEGSAVSNLDWLDVDEQAYRELETLPKQNLDIAPDLEALWSHQDGSPSKLVPNTGAPRTMGDLSEAHGRLRSVPEDLIRTARLAIIQTTNPQKISNLLKVRYDGDTLVAAKTALSQVFAERGLLGRLYIAASDFTNCQASADFVRRFASEAKYVLAKQACGDCTRRHAQANGSSHCSVFHKEIQLDVPYSEALAREVEKREVSKGKAIQASSADPKERIRNAFLAEEFATSSSFTGRTQVVSPRVAVDTNQVLISAENLTKQRKASEQKALAEVKARPIVALLRREMIKGRSAEELVKTLRLAFDVRDLGETQAVWAPLFKEAGLYGAVYITQESFDDCREGADFTNKHASKARAIVAGNKCSSCFFRQAARCMMYGRKLIGSAEEVLTTETVQAVIDEGRIAGKLPYDAAQRHWGSTPVEALKALHKAASAPLAGTVLDVRGTIERAFHGATRVNQTGELTKRNIVKAASRYLNEGLYGEDLKQVLQSSFGPRDLLAAAQELKVVLAEQGLQGIKYIDPTVYADYGKGCAEAARLHRSRSAVRYAKVGPSCGSCVHQSCPGTCSVLNKLLVVEPPYIDKLAEQQAILDSGRSTEVTYASLVNNGLTTMQEYQLQNQDMSLDLNPVMASDATWVEFGVQQELKL